MFLSYNSGKTNDQRKRASHGREQRPLPYPRSRRGRGHPGRPRRRANVSPYRTDDDAVVRREDFAHDRATLTRPAFVRDIEKILNLPAYNRYADKTQVFSFAENDEIAARPARAAGEPRGSGHREPARAELRPHRGHRAGPRHGPHAPSATPASASYRPATTRAPGAPSTTTCTRCGCRQPVPPQHLAADARRCSATTASSPSRCCARERRPRSSSWTTWWRPARPTSPPSRPLRPSTLEGWVGARGRHDRLHRQGSP